MKLTTIVFDADGVLQESTEPFIDLLRKQLGVPEAEADALIERIFEAERPCMLGQADFPTELRRVLREAGRESSYERAVVSWRSIQVDQASLELVLALRRGGFACYLASNQHSYRARYMAHDLGYDRYFDRTFFSCEFGCLKPEQRYFERLVEEIGRAPAEILFIDDGPKNVAAASALGIEAHRFPVPCPGPRAEVLRHILGEHGVHVSSE
jgi:putative hydrolase of the HAD superfamily